MNLFKNWNPINTIENIIVIIATVVFMNVFVVKPLRGDIHSLQKSIVLIAMQPRYSISNDFDKMRGKDGSTIILDLNNKLNHLELMPVDTASMRDTVVEKRGFLKRLFN